MEISEVVNTQLAFHGLVVGFVLVCAVLVFVFGFKSVEPFPFDKLATVVDDRKPAGKKRKVKDKKSQSNGQATVVPDAKQKISETVNKTTTNKTKQIDKSPTKDVPKPGNKQEKKQAKTDSPSSKAALKDTKNIKESNKLINEGQKQGKNKESVIQIQKDEKSNKQMKNKGKENVEIKNKRNMEKSKLKVDEKPKDFDEGEWEQAISRKDKKNRKPALSDEDNITEKAVKAEVLNAGKKKKSKSIGVESSSVVEPTPPVIDGAPDQKLNKKDKEQKKDIKPVVEAIIPENTVENIEPEGDGKVAKKKKKKPVTKESSDTGVIGDNPTNENLVSSKSADPKITEDPQVNNGVVFDELGDTWQESKTQKKTSKKKVRKAE